MFSSSSSPRPMAVESQCQVLRHFFCGAAHWFRGHRAVFGNRGSSSSLRELLWGAPKSLFGLLREKDGCFAGGFRRADFLVFDAIDWHVPAPLLLTPALFATPSIHCWGSVPSLQDLLKWVHAPLPSAGGGGGGGAEERSLVLFIGNCDSRLRELFSRAVNVSH